MKNEDQKMNLFDRFLHDPDQYDAAETLWHDRWNELVRYLRRERLWHAPWINTHFSDGSKMRDANPIFSAFSPECRRAVRIIQIEPSAGPVLTLSTETFAKGDPEELPLLTVVCVLNQETVLEVMDALHQWVSAGQVRGRMRIDHYDTKLWEADETFPSPGRTKMAA